jgi:hypothetical protein
LFSDVTFHDLISPVVRVVQDLIEAQYNNLGTAIGHRGHFEVRAKYAPRLGDSDYIPFIRSEAICNSDADIDSAVDHVILYVGPPEARNARGQRCQWSEVVVFIEDKVCFSRSCFATT